MNINAKTFPTRLFCLLPTVMLATAGLLAVAVDSPTFAVGAERVPDAPGRWTPERANEWYAAQLWLVGCNYIPSSAINQLEMFQAATFDPTTIDRELGWARGLGSTSCACSSTTCCGSRIGPASSHGATNFSGSPTATASG